MGENFKSWNAVKDRIIPRLRYEGNVTNVDEYPHNKLGDIVQQYVIILEDDDDGESVAYVSNELVQAWGVSAKIVSDASIKNLARLREAYFGQMHKVIFAIATGGENGGINELESVDGLEEDSLVNDELYILRTECPSYGASIISDCEVLDKIYEAYGGEYWILPSSVHEVLIISTSFGKDPAELLWMVRDINRTEVLPKDKLSDNIYKYDGWRLIPWTGDDAE